MLPCKSTSTAPLSQDNVELCTMAPLVSVIVSIICLSPCAKTLNAPLLGLGNTNTRFWSTEMSPTPLVSMCMSPA